MLWQAVALKEMRDEGQFRNEVCRNLLFLRRHSHFRSQVLFRETLEDKECSNAVVRVLHVHVPEARQQEFRNEAGFGELVASQPSEGMRL